MNKKNKYSVGKLTLQANIFSDFLTPEPNPRNHITRDYERKLDTAFDLPWATSIEFLPEDFDDISGVRECFDSVRYLKDNPPIKEAIEKGVVSSPWDHWLQFGQMQRRFARFNLPFEVINDQNLNEDIFIFFDRTTIAPFSPLFQEIIRTKTTLDFASFNLQSPPNYILVSNPRDHLIATKMAPSESSVILLRPMDDPRKVLQTLAIPHINVNLGNIFDRRGLPRYLTGPKAPIYGQNEYIAALHFAFVLGSHRLILVGDIPETSDEIKYLPKILSEIKAHGVEVLSNTKNSICHQSGATYLPIEEMLPTSGFDKPQSTGHRLLNDGYETNSKALFISKASGSIIIDRNGKRYLDTGMAAGSAILGHANSTVNEAIIDALSDGSLFCKPTPSGEELGARLHDAFPWHSHFALCNTGSEATMRLIRIARNFTGRSKIALFSGSWHGSHDFLLVDDDASNTEDHPTQFLRSSGSPKELLDLNILLPYNRDAAFEIIRRKKDEIAVVITEPIQGSNPKESDVDFMRELREVTKDCDVLLAFDEIITGGRLGLGGFQERYGIQAELTAYGKIFGGGLPIGFVGGIEEIMRTIKEPEVRGGGKANDKSVVLGGTFSGNPLTISSANATLKILRENSEELYSFIDSAGDRIRQDINIYCKDHGIKARMYGIGSICRLIMSDKMITSARHRDEEEPSKETQTAFYNNLLNKGIHVAANRLIFISAAHTEEQITTIIKEFNNALMEFSMAKLL
jgi:glutamate-1-semialdehyde 2,1-aminomutase